MSPRTPLPRSLSLLAAALLVSTTLSGHGDVRTGKAGEADPIETHVYLETSEPDETAREMLDMSEQTCFLHAFCKTEMKTKLKINRV